MGADVREPRSAPTELQVHVRQVVRDKGLKVRKSEKAVVPFVQGPRPRTMRHRFIDPSQPRWVAMCPAGDCNGAEVVSVDTDFLCGSCGTECAVDWGEVR